MEERVYRLKVRDVEDLRGCVLPAWDELDQCIIDKAVGEWRKFVSMRMADNLNTNFDWLFILGSFC